MYLAQHHFWLLSSHIFIHQIMGPKNVCIIGAGAIGIPSCKVLMEYRIREVVLARGQNLIHTRMLDKIENFRDTQEGSYSRMRPIPKRIKCTSMPALG